MAQAFTAFYSVAFLLRQSLCIWQNFLGKVRMDMESRLQQREPQKAEIDRPNLTGIPTQMKLSFEQRSGMSFDDVRVHYNSDKPAQFHALAYTQGTQIYVGPGQERSLSHELVHVIQQKAGRVRPRRWVRGQPVNDQPELEREADRSPVQCMPAPAPQGVIQMFDVPVMSRQIGANCGYHALARAICALCGSDELCKQYLKDSFLERQLTSNAIQMGYSVIGEAFYPDALAEVGNTFCKELYEQHNIKISCTVVAFKNKDKLKEILDVPNSIVLVPYFRMGAWNPTKNPGGYQNAHWSAIKADGTSYNLYEGNYHGSRYYDEEGNLKELGPLGVEFEDLFTSNMSISDTFDWLEFLTDGVWNQTSFVPNYYDQLKEVVKCIVFGKKISPDLSWIIPYVTEAFGQINQYKADVVMNPNAENSQPFSDYNAFFKQLHDVKGQITKISKVQKKNADPLKQDVPLAGQAVIVQKGISPRVQSGDDIAAAGGIALSGQKHVGS